MKTQHTDKHETPNNTYLQILQINLCKSPGAHLALINDDLCNEWDILLVQEPHANYFEKIATPTGFRQVYPENDLRKQKGVRSAIWVNSDISTNSWQALKIPNTVDITAVQIKTDNGTKISIFNIYNNCTNDNAQNTLNKYMLENRNELLGNNNQVLWCGDFNRHPLWDNDCDAERLFTRQALNQSACLIKILAEWDLVMMLPKGTPTLKHWGTHNFSRPDNVFRTEGLTDLIVKCEVLPEKRPPKTDHFPIGTILNVTKEMAPPTPTRNFCTADWEVIRNHLSNNVTTAKEDGRLMDVLNTYADFDRQVVTINMLIKSAIEENIPETTQRPTTRRWWTTELTLLKCEGNKLSRRSWSFCALPNHKSHKAYSTHQNLFDIKVKEAKQQHWEDFLETVTEREMWIANGYIKSPVGDAGRPHIPSLQTKDQNGATHTHDLLCGPLHCMAI